MLLILLPLAYGLLRLDQDQGGGTYTTWPGGGNEDGPQPCMVDYAGNTGEAGGQINCSQQAQDNPIQQQPSASECAATCQAQQNSECICDAQMQQVEPLYVPNEEEQAMDCAEQCGENGTKPEGSYGEGPGGESPGGGTPETYQPPARPMYQPPTVKRIRVPVERPVTIRDRITSMVTSIVTSLVEAPPVTVTKQAQTVTITQHARPVTKSMPPLVFQIPTTIIKTAKPETIIKTLPPQVIYQPPVTSTVHHQIEYPPNTVVVNRTLRPVTKTVRVSGPTRTVVMPPQTKTRVATKTLPPRTVTVEVEVPAPEPEPPQAPMPMVPMVPAMPSQPQYGGGSGGMGGGSGGGSGGLQYPGGGYPSYGGEGGGSGLCECPEYTFAPQPMPARPSRPSKKKQCDCPPQQQQPPQPQQQPQQPQPQHTKPSRGSAPCVPESGCVSSGNKCSKNTSNCYGSMLQSNYQLESSGELCGTSNISMCEDDQRVMEPEDTSKASSLSGQEGDNSEGMGSFLVGREEGTPNVMLASHFLRRR